MYEAMARRYRPHTFDDVIGQEHVAQTLKNSITAQRVAHAYLFCGPHGCGKTSMARIFACALVCENGPTASPCGKCPICSDVLKGQDVDVQEIDGASNNGVEQVRSLREQAGYIPSRARFKIYIIDEVHMLSVAAFNALLKTLEEPPAHVKFILATTDPHKIIGTILSRCQRFDFRLVPPVKMSSYLRKLVESERAEITDDALAAVAAFSGGSMRDGLVLLDQLVSFSSGKVTREDVERVRGVAGAESVAGLYEAVASHDVIRALEIVDSVSALGTNVGDFLDQLIAFGRDLMLVAATGSDESVSAYGPARSILLELSTAVSLEQTLLMLDVFSQARIRVRSKALTNTLIPLEMAVSRLAGLESLNAAGDIVARLSAYAAGVPLPQTGLPQPVSRSISAIAESLSNSEPDVVMARERNAKVLSGLNAEADKAEDNRVPWSEKQVNAAETDIAGEAGCGQQEYRAVDMHSDPVVQDVAGQAEEGLSPAEPVVSESDFSSRPADISVDYENVCRHDDPYTVSVASVDEAETVPVKSAEKESAASTDIDLQDLWRGILQVLNSKSKTDAPFLSDVFIESYEHGKLFLSVPGGGTFIFEQLEDTFRRKRIADSAAEILGCEVEIHLKMREEPSAESAADADSLYNAPQLESPVHRMREAGKERGVRIIMENFEGSIINIEDA